MQLNGLYGEFNPLELFSRRPEDRNNWLANNQFGFRKRCTVYDALALLNYNIFLSIDKGIKACSIFLELANVFHSFATVKL